MKLIGIGDNVVDFYEDQGVYYPGGNALNVAVLSKRNKAEKNAYMGIVGDDSEADHIIQSLSFEGIDTTRVRQVYGINAKAHVSINDQGDRVFIKSNKEDRVQSKVTLQFTDEDLDYIQEFDVIHTSINSNIEHELNNLSKTPISFDFSTNSKWNDSYLEKVCPYVQIAFFSGDNMRENDIYSLFEYVHHLGVKIVCVTRGKNDVLCFDGESVYRQPTKPISVVDTMGAGDSFIAGFLTSYFTSCDMEGALLSGTLSAANTCLEHGAFGYSTKSFRQ